MNTGDKILNKLKAGRYQSQIASDLGISKGAVSKQIKKLQEQGLIEKEGRSSINFWKINKLTNKLTKRRLTSNKMWSTAHTVYEQAKPAIKQAQPNQQKETYRQHRVWLELPLHAEDKPIDKQAIKKRLLKLGYKDAGWGIENQYVLYLPNYKGYKVTRYSKTLKVVPPDQERLQNEALPAQMQAEALEKAMGIALELQKLLKLNFVQESGVLIGYLVSEEIAETNNPTAKAILKEKRDKIRIKHPGTNHVCFLVDASPPNKTAHPGIQGWEAEVTLPSFNTAHLEKFNEIREDLGKAGEASMVADLRPSGVESMLDDALHRDGWSLMKERQLRSDQLQVQTNVLLQGLTMEVKDFSTQLTIHIPAYEKMGQSSERLAEEVSNLRKDFKNVSDAIYKLLSELRSRE